MKQWAVRRTSDLNPPLFNTSLTVLTPRTRKRINLRVQGLVPEQELRRSHVQLPSLQRRYYARQSRTRLIVVDCPSRLSECKSCLSITAPKGKLVPHSPRIRPLQREKSKAERGLAPWTPEGKDS